ncbi:MAG TPA: DUF481 domain-containing protein [Vicinamibacterales bacterium]|nr:DUF481 domain-containing protein [Vicinamibacterales bacterium]
MRYTVAALVLLVPTVAFAQSADDVASRVGVVARTMSVDAPEKWKFDSVFGTDVKRGNADTTAMRFTAVYLRNTGTWRFGTYGSAAIEHDNGVKTNDRAGLNFAAAKTMSTTLRLVMLEEIVRAPLDGLDLRNLLGSVVVWTPGKTAPPARAKDAPPAPVRKLETSIYAGAGWASETYIDATPGNDYGAALAGASATVTLSPTATLALVQSYTHDLTESENFKLGTIVAMKAAINTVFGVQLSYALAYDHHPLAGVKTTNNAFSAGFTVGWKAK